LLISIKQKFVFIANLKTASTSIETTLKPFSDIALTKSEEGKHMPFRVIEERFGRIFHDVGRQKFLIFGVMRNSVDFVLSLYNSHTDDRFKNNSCLYTGGLDFDQFLAEWTKNNPDQIQPQCIRFLDRQGKIGADYIISYQKLVDGLGYVASVIDVPDLLKLHSENVSRQRLRRSDLSEKQLAWIAHRFKEDEQFAAQFCDRRLCRNLVPSENTKRLAATSTIPQSGANSAVSTTITGIEGCADEQLFDQDTTALKQINQEDTLLVPVFDKDVVCRSSAGNTSRRLIEPVSSSTLNGNAVTTAVGDAAAVEGAVSIGTHIDTDQLVADACKMALGRPGDPSGLPTLGSPEFQSKRAVAGKWSSSPPNRPQIHAFTPEEPTGDPVSPISVDEFIAAAYAAVLERRPDPGAFRAYRKAFKDVSPRLGLERTLKALLRSEEFQSKQVLKALDRLNKSKNNSRENKTDVLFVQTADPEKYRILLELSSKTVEEYCRKNNFHYHSYLGILRGYHTWQATFNRIPILHRLAESGFSGWVCYLDADAFVADLNFDLLSYLGDKTDIALIAASGGQSFWWDVNAGVLFLNLGHPLGQAIVREWHTAFGAITDDQLRVAVVWSTVPDDQSLLQQVLRTMPYVENHIVVDRAHPPLINYEGRFIKQVLRVAGSLEEREDRLRTEVSRVLGHI
jgi:hypothetical protein